MKKIITTIFILSLLGLSFPFALASGGACSGHEGVNCNAGPDEDGSVICNDGWTDSSVNYSDIRDVCNEDFNPFSDVNIIHPNNEAILSLYEWGVIGGYPDLTFKPDNEVNRAEFLKILVEGAGTTPDATIYNNCFPDVTDEWYAPYVCYAQEQDWVEGYPDGMFQPVNPVNKVEAIKMLLEVQGLDIPESITEAPFDDVSLDDWFASYVSVAKDKGLLEVTGNSLTPGEDMTRALISEMTYRAVIVVDNSLESFEDYVLEDEEVNEDLEEEDDDEEDEEEEENEEIENVEEEETNEEEEEEDQEPDVEITTMSLHLFWTNWDADAEEDGIEVSPFFKDEIDDLIYPQIQDWTITVDVYNHEMNDSYDYVKTDLLYSNEFSGDDVKYESILGTPFVRIPKEEIENPSDEYGYVEATFSSPTYGDFSAYDDFTTISD